MGVAQTGTAHDILTSQDTSLQRSKTMKRLLTLAALAVFTFAEFAAVTALTVAPAEAVVCARGVYRAGCAGPLGAAVVRAPVVGAPVVRRPVGASAAGRSLIPMTDCMRRRQTDAAAI